MNSLFYSNEENNENFISLSKITENVYDIFIHNENIHLNAEKSNKKISIYSDDLLATIKWKTFGSKFKVYKGDNKNHPIMLRNCKQIYLPPKCVQHNGINSFKTTEISRLEKYQYLTIYNDSVYLDNEIILARYTNDLGDMNFCFKSELTIMQAVCIIFFLI
jgi:hypothetical protein